jgi:hypothetical protein
MEVIVADVLDGKTFVTTSGTTVILKDVPVPGLMDTDGRRAKERLEELILHQRVECIDVEDDSRRNYLAVVLFEGENVNESIRHLLRTAPSAEPAEAEPKPKKIEITFDESAFGARPPKGDRKS